MVKSHRERLERFDDGSPAVFLDTKGSIVQVSRRHFKKLDCWVTVAKGGNLQQPTLVAYRNAQVTARGYYAWRGCKRGFDKFPSLQKVRLDTSQDSTAANVDGRNASRSGTRELGHTQAEETTQRLSHNDAEDAAQDADLRDTIHVIDYDPPRETPPENDQTDTRRQRIVDLHPSGINQETASHPKAMSGPGRRLSSETNPQIVYAFKTSNNPNGGDRRPSDLLNTIPLMISPEVSPTIRVEGSDRRILMGQSRPTAGMVQPSQQSGIRPAPSTKDRFLDHTNITILGPVKSEKFSLRTLGNEEKMFRFARIVSRRNRRVISGIESSDILLLKVKADVDNDDIAYEAKMSEVEENYDLVVSKGDEESFQKLLQFARENGPWNHDTQLDGRGVLELEAIIPGDD